jgi:hypothetical protein
MAKGHQTIAYGSIKNHLCHDGDAWWKAIEDLDTGSQYLPDLNLGDPQYGKQLTLRHLLAAASDCHGWEGLRFPYPDSLSRFVPIKSLIMFCCTRSVHHAILLHRRPRLKRSGKYYDDLVPGMFLIHCNGTHRV